MTNYIVLRRDAPSGPTGPSWRIIGQTEASGPEQARKKIAGEQEGEFLVVPVRNATFVSASVQVPPPKVTAVAVAVETYLGEQVTLDVDDEVPEPVVA